MRISIVVIAAVACSLNVPVLAQDPAPTHHERNCPEFGDPRAAWIQPDGDRGALFVLNVGKAVEAIDELANQKREVYSECGIGLRAGEQYAAAQEGWTDAPGVEVSTNHVKKGIFQAMGDSIAENPTAWAMGAAAAVAGAYYVYDHNQSEDDSRDPAPPAANTTQGPGSVVIQGDGNTVNISAPVAPPEEVAAE